MGTTSFPSTPLNADLQKVIINLNMIAEELDHILGGKLDTKNIREIGGWLASRYKLQSKDGNVGLNTDNIGDDPIRIWAGDAMEGQPNFKVTKAGILTAVAALFLTSMGYPRLEINSDDKLLKASLDETHFIAISPNDFGDFVVGAPSLNFQGPGSSMSMFMTPDDSGSSMITATGKITIITASMNGLSFSCPSGNMRVQSHAGTIPDLIQAILDLQSTVSTMQADINGLQARVAALEAGGGA